MSFDPVPTQVGKVETDQLRLLGARADVIIGSDCLISAGAIILPGVRIGDGSVVGAGAVVSRDIPPFSIVVGIPASIIRKRTTRSDFHNT